MIMGIVTLTLGLIVLVYLLTKKTDLSQDKNRTETRYRVYMWIYIEPYFEI